MVYAVGEVFDKQEVQDMICAQGFEPGSPDYNQALRRQFIPAEGMPGFYAEQPSTLEKKNE